MNSWACLLTFVWFQDQHVNYEIEPWLSILFYVFISKEVLDSGNSIDICCQCCSCSSEYPRYHVASMAMQEDTLEVCLQQQTADSATAVPPNGQCFISNHNYNVIFTQS